MRVAPQSLIEGVVRALHEQVLPHVDSRVARGQLWAAIDVLRNLAARVELAAEPLEAEATSAATALAALADQVRGDDAAFAADVARQIADAPAAPASARADALRTAFAGALARLDALPPARADALRPILGGHLAAQAVRDLARLQPSLLEEISRG